jgi:lysophospholipase L1-like esterase
VFFLLIFIGIGAASGEVITAFGDSITQGYPFILEPGGGRRIGGYEPELEVFFNEIGIPIIVLNYGAAGEITPWGLSRIDRVLAESQADYILILEGTNDFFHGISVNTTIFNLGLMIDKSRAHNVEPIIATLSPDLRSNNKRVEINYNPHILRLASQKGVLLADQYSALAGKSWDVDGLHPNEYGYRLMAREWFDALSNAIKRNGNRSPDRENIEAFVTRFYQQCLGRDSEPEGLNFYTVRLLNGTASGAIVAGNFINSPEFINQNTTNEEYLNIMYRAFFDREPDESGWNYYRNWFDQGIGRDKVFNGFIYSPEFQNLCNRYGIIPYF